MLSKCWVRKLAASKTLAGTKLLVSDADGVCLEGLGEVKVPRSPEGVTPCRGWWLYPNSSPN